MPDQSQYAAAAHVPLIKSPSLRVPPPVELPPDIHPLPDSITPYFAYPFTLEPHVLTMESSRRTAISAHAVRREAYLRSRQDEKERRKRDALRKIAPGFEPQGAVLVPTRASSAPLIPSEDIVKTHRPAKSVMEDLVDQLAALDATTPGRTR
ncbi:hypothetical protein BD779DRAFT_1612467 [Infundibulicybe gibba]|nr:hypothetical protein BD779DRAFT_1612467 [Infundibulicybe gibba]